MARRTQDTHALMVALAGRHTALLHIEHLPERLEIGREWLELSELRRHREVTAQALHWRVYDLCESGDLAQAGAAREQLQVLADELRQPLYQHFAAAWEAKWLEMAGDFDAAERKALESFERAQEAKAAYAKSNYAGQLFGLRRDQGRLGGLSPVVTPLIGDDPHLAVWRTGLVLAHLESGDTERATKELARFAADDFKSVPKDLFWLGATCLLAESSAALGEREASATLRRLLTPYAEYNAQIGLAVAVGPVHRFLGLLAAVLGDADAAIDHFHRALDWSRAQRRGDRRGPRPVRAGRAPAAFRRCAGAHVAGALTRHRGAAGDEAARGPCRGAARRVGLESPAWLTITITPPSCPRRRCACARSRACWSRRGSSTRPRSTR